MENKRAFIAPFSIESSRNTQLYRTLLHEFGHYVQYQTNVLCTDDDDDRLKNIYFSLPKNEKEKYANHYANELKNKLINKKILPFEPK